MKKPARVKQVFLQPGDFYFGTAATRIRTILGSCVSITIWHPQKHIGGMCHFMLPSRADTPAGTLDGRYADEALQMFMKNIPQATTQPSDYRVKLFGAGNMFPGLANKSDGQSLGISALNIAAARSLVEQYGFTVVAEDMGGHGHREVIFELWSGDAWVKQTPPKKIIKRERIT